MRLFLYYAAHTFKNQLKKIFKSWVLIFILACALVGGLIGFTAAKIGSMVQEKFLAGDFRVILPTQTIQGRA